MAVTPGFDLCTLCTLAALRVGCTGASKGVCKGAHWDAKAARPAGRRASHGWLPGDPLKRGTEREDSVALHASTRSDTVAGIQLVAARRTSMGVGNRGLGLARPGQKGAQVRVLPARQVVFLQECRTMPS